MRPDPADPTAAPAADSPSAVRAADRPDAPRVLIIGCGALARELLAVTRDMPCVEVTCVDARLHMRPERIAGAVSAATPSSRQ